MGKGSRNRQLRVQTDAPVKLKKQQKKQTPKWVTPLVSWVIVAAIVLGAVAIVISNLGVVKRNRVLIESQTGKYDITQQVATFIAWQNIYYNSYYYYQYASIGYIDDKNVTKQYPSADSYALTVAQYSIQERLRNSVEDIVESLLDYVVVCDAAHKAGITLDAKDKEEITSTIDWLKSMQTALGFANFNGFLKGAIDTGMRKSDVEKAMEIVCLYNKYSQQLGEGYEQAVKLSDLTIFRDENPQDYYKIDYIGFASDDKDFAEALKACTSADQFRELVVKHHFDKNYKTAYNKFTVTAAAADALTAVKSKTDLNGSTALSDELNKLQVPQKETYVNDENNKLPKAVKEWLFSKTRTQYQVNQITVDEGIYLIAFYSAQGSETSVEARIKFYEFEEGEAHDGNSGFKAAILAQLWAEKQAMNLEEKLEHKDADVDAILTANNAVEMTGVDKNNTEMPKVLLDKVMAASVKEKDVIFVSEFGVHYVAYVRAIKDGKVDVAYCTVGTATEYRSAVEKATALEKALKDLDGDLVKINKMLNDNKAIKKDDVTSSTSSTELPTVITKAVTATGVKAKDIIAVGGDYVVFVHGIENKKVDISYVQTKSDVYYQIHDELESSLEEVYPATKTGSYTEDAEKKSLNEWLSALEEGDGIVSARKEFDTTIIEKTTTKDEVTTTTYTTYMVVNTPMYLATDTVYNGGYLQFTDSKKDDKEQKPPHATQAADALAALQGKTGYELRDALLELDSSASTSVSYTDSSFTDSNVREWFMDPARQENDIEVLTSADGKSSYIVIYRETMLSWERTAKTNYVNDQLEKQIDEWAKDYSINAKVLAKLGKLETTSETTEETTTAA